MPTDHRFPDRRSFLRLALVGSTGAATLSILPRSVAAAPATAARAVVHLMLPDGFNEMITVPASERDIIEYEGATCQSNGDGNPWLVPESSMLAAVLAAADQFALPWLVGWFWDYFGLYVYEIGGYRARCDGFIGWQALLNGVDVGEGMDAVMIVDGDAITIQPYQNTSSVDEPKGRFSLSLSPNPVATVLRLVGRDVPGTEATVGIYDAAGRQALPARAATIASGRVQVAVECSMLPAGTYLCRLTAGRRITSSRFVVLR